uniref:Transmembrane protein 184C n=2 Tax=Clastoptera arizonana TaxID=38151 RepID=A0A1B6DCU8_9HEMI
MFCSNILSKWRQWIKNVVMCIYTIFVLLLLPKLIITSINRKKDKHDETAFIGGVFVMMAIPISLWEIVQHMVHYSQPALQLHIIRILWMVPIYALNAWLGLVYPDQTIYMDSFRECYEAYVIYNFMRYLLNYLNADSNLEERLKIKPQVKHMIPFCWLSQWKMGKELIHNCKHGILQYTTVRPVTTAIAFICDQTKIYGEGEFTAKKAFPYLIVINNVSQFIAMYCLVLFYQACKEELRPMKPIGKFLCIKAVVFFSFFQGVLISILVYTNVISFVFDTDDDDTIRNISSKIQNFLICIEMFLAAIAHHYSFSHKPYIDGIVENKSLCAAFLAMWDVSDVHSDMKEHFGIVGNKISYLNRSIRGQWSENTPLFVDTPSAESQNESGYQSIGRSNTDVSTIST